MWGIDPALYRLIVTGVVLVVVLAGLWLGRGTWLPSIGRFLIYTDPRPLQPAQAVLPLAGARERGIYAAQLYRQGYAEWFLVTDMPFAPPGVRQSYAELVRQEAVWQGVPEAQIRLIGEEVTSTYAEARSVRRWMETQGFDSVLVVTSAYHTRRAALILRDVFRGSDIRVQVAPVAEGEYQAESWWKEAGAGRPGQNISSWFCIWLGIVERLGWCI
jgi:uncharacterized SAM-binding protein YcdF (DUF218 family)